MLPLPIAYSEDAEPKSTEHGVERPHLSPPSFPPHRLISGHAESHPYQQFMENSAHSFDHFTHVTHVT